MCVRIYSIVFCVCVYVYIYMLSPLENLATEMRQGISWAKNHLLIFLQIKTV